MNELNLLHNIAEHISKNLSDYKRLTCGLLAGDFGKIIFLYKYSKTQPEYESIADSLLEKLFSTYKLQDYVLTYCNGIAGFGLGLTLLEKDGFISGVSNSLLPFDNLLSKGVQYYINNDNIDFLHGLVGIGFYFLSRIQVSSDISIHNLTKIVQFLYSKSIVEYSTDNTYWTTWIFDNKDRTKRYNISLSHGISSIAILLCRILSLNISPILNNRCRYLITGIRNYLLRQRINPAIYGSFFPMFPKEDGRPIYKSRLAWCYGDIGIGIALRNIANINMDDKLMAFSQSIAKFTAEKRINPNDNMVYDAGICHGAAGISQYFKSIYYKTKEDIYYDAYQHWRNITLDMSMQINGILQFPKCDCTKQTMIACDSILEGNAGCGLMLLNADKILNNILLYE